MTPPDNPRDPYPGYHRRLRLHNTSLLLVTVLLFVLPALVDALLFDLPHGIWVACIVPVPILLIDATTLLCTLFFAAGMVLVAYAALVAP